MKYWLVFSCLAMLFIYSCAPKVMKQSTAVEYEEDISHLLPSLDSVPEPENATDNTPIAYVPPSNDITQELDALLDSLSHDALKKPVQQYTVQVYVGNDSKEANEVRMEVFKVLSDEKPRIEWSQPNFRVKVGQFTSRLEAYKTLSILRKHFPSALLVPERVYLN